MVKVVDNNAKPLPSKTISEAVDEAKGLVQTERSGEINGLYTRWRGVNRALMKYWRFNTVTVIAGASGSGKSAILNMIEDDFTNPQLNPSFLGHSNKDIEPRIMLLAFKYEMDAADEVLRNLSGKVEKSYSYLLSSQTITKFGPLENESYNKVTDEEYDNYCKKLDSLRNKPIRFIELAGTVDQLYSTCAYYKEKFPNRRLVVTLDHSLLSQKLSEKDDLELTAHTAHTAIRLRKNFGALVIFLAQLNGEIEKPIRREKEDLHFPVKTDIHCGNQLYWACDNVIVVHRPELLGITKYGRLQGDGQSYSINSKKVIHWAWIKSRKNKTGHIWFENQFDRGGMIQIDPSSVKWIYNPKELPI